MMSFLENNHSCHKHDARFRGIILGQKTATGEVLQGGFALKKQQTGCIERYLCLFVNKRVVKLHNVNLFRYSPNLSLGNFEFL